MKEKNILFLLNLSKKITFVFMLSDFHPQDGFRYAFKTVLS